MDELQDLLKTKEWTVWGSPEQVAIANHTLCGYSVYSNTDSLYGMLTAVKDHKYPGSNNA